MNKTYLTLRTCGVAVALCALSACAETETDPNDGTNDAGLGPSFDAGPGLPAADAGARDATVTTPFQDAASFVDASSWPEASTVIDSGSTTADAGPAKDAGDPVKDVLDDLFPTNDGGSTGPIDPGPKGPLDPNGAINPQLPPKAANGEQCPSLAPANPVGDCLGLPIYLLCSYGADSGPQYTCTCDWYHWLCV